MSSLKKCILFLILSPFTSVSFAEEDLSAFEVNKKLGRGVNLGNALEAPREGQWGVTLQEEYFKLIKRAGFDSVRIPIKWSAHTQEEKPYTIDPNFFRRVDWALTNALANELCVIINIHHYDEIYDKLDDHKERFLIMWQQIAEHFKSEPEKVLFELLNEPCKNLNDEIWNGLLAKTLKEVRKTNPDRMVLIGPTNWNNIDTLDKLILPENDRKIIVTCHYYSPFNFTHQGASWVGEQSNSWLGTKWTGTEEEKLAIEKDFDKALKWGNMHNRPVNIGEFGVYSRADMQSRALWTDFIARQAEKRDFSWAYWEFCSGFGVYDLSEKKWREPLLKALIPNTKTGDD